VDKVQELLVQIDADQDSDTFWQTCSPDGCVWERAAGELVRLARLGAAVEAMPEGIGIVHRRSALDGDWVTFRDDEHFKFGGCIGSHSLEAIVPMLKR
jgi:hypothetical protein